MDFGLLETKEDECIMCAHSLSPTCCNTYMKLITFPKCIQTDKQDIEDHLVSHF